MLAIQPGSFHCGNEKLGPIWVRASVGHRKQPRRCVLKIKVFILKFVTIDWITSCSISTLKISALKKWKKKIIFPTWSIITCSIKLGMTLWNLEPVYENPASPVAICLKFSAVLGTFSSNSSMLILPRGTLSAETSKYTLDLFTCCWPNNRDGISSGTVHTKYPNFQDIGWAS